MELQQRSQQFQARRAFLKVLKNSNGSHHGTLNNLEKVGGKVGVMGRGESLEVVETEPLQCNDYQFKPGQDMDRQWSNHQRDSRCVREKIQMAYERVDRNSQTNQSNSATPPPFEGTIRPFYAWNKSVSMTSYPPKEKTV